MPVVGLPYKVHKSGAPFLCNLLNYVRPIAKPEFFIYTLDMGQTYGPNLTGHKAGRESKMKSSVELTAKKDRRIARRAAEWAYSDRNWKHYHDIYEAYKNPSIYKVRAWNRCKDLCARMNGWGLTISAAGVQTFSVVFSYPDEVTGEICYAYITRDYDRFCYESDPV